MKRLIYLFLTLFIASVVEVVMEEMAALAEVVEVVEDQLLNPQEKQLLQLLLIIKYVRQEQVLAILKVM